MNDRPFNLGIDPADAEARLQQLLQPTGFAEGGPARRSLRDAIAELTGPEGQSEIDGRRAESPSLEGMGEGMAIVGEGVAPLARMARDYGVSRYEDPSQIPSDLSAVGSALKHAFMEDPINFLAGLNPFVGAAQSMAAIPGIRDAVKRAQEAGDEAGADKLKAGATLAALGIGIPGARGEMAEISKAVPKRKMTLAEVRREFDPRAGEGMSGDDLERLVDAYGRVASPASEHPELAAKGREIADTYITKGGMEYGSGRNYFNTKPSVPLEELGRVADTIPYSHELKPIVEKPWEEVIRERRDSPMITLGGDLSDWVRLRGYGPQDDLRALARASDIHAGFDYMREPNRFTVWANAPEHAEMLEKKILTDPAIQNAIKRDLPVLGTPAPMGPRAIDSAKNFMDTYLSAVEASPIPDKFLKEANEKLKSGLFGSTPKDKDRIRKVFSDFPGFENIDAARDFMLNNPEVSGKMRAAVIKGMEKDGFVKQGFPEVGQLRVAATSPKFMMAPGNMIGGRLVELDPKLFAVSREEANKFFDHFTYTGDTPGIYYADTPLVHRHHAAPDVTDRAMAAYNVERPNPKNPDKPKPPMTVHPFSLDQTGRDTWRKLFEEQRRVQPLNERMLESIQRGEARRGLYGFAEGGSVSGDSDMDDLYALHQKYAEGGPVLPSYDPMGSFTGMEGLDQGGREAGLYERLADDMAGAGMAVGEPVRQAVEGISDVPSSIARYLAETSEKPDPSQRVAEDIRRVGGAMYDQATSSPTEFAKTVGGFLPGIGEAISAYDAKQLYGDLQKAEAEGDMGKADTLRQLYGLASAGAIPGVGIGARVAGKAAQAVERAAARELTPLGLYSHGAESALALPQPKGAPEQMAAMLQKYGVKPDEMYATGFADEAATAAARSKIEAEFAPKVAEAQKAMEGLEPGTPEFKAAERQFKNISSTMRSEMDRALVLGEDWAARPSVTREEIAAHFKERMPQIEERIIPGNDPDSALSRWGNLEDLVLPGGENYREILLKLPQDYGKSKKMVRDIADAKVHANEMNSAYHDALEAELTGTSKLSPEEFYDIKQKADIANFMLRQLEQDSSEPVYRSGHWNKDSNVLAHLRMSDRTGPNGEKILHVEEIQSDWGQGGRDSGWASHPDTVDAWYAKKNEIKKQIKDLTDRQQKIGYGSFPEYDGSISPAEYQRQLNSHYDQFSQAPEFIENSKKIRDLSDALREHDRVQPKTSGKFPAPYVQNTQSWTDLALKRALKEAAEGGYDKLVWTPGAEQAKRYDLTKHVNEIKYDPNEQMLLAYDHNGHEVMNERGVEPHEIAKHIGKEPAEKLLREVENSTSALKEYEIARDPETKEWGLYLYGEPLHDYGGEQMTFMTKADARGHLQEMVDAEIAMNPPSISGLDLKIGGEGMKGYYDKIVPAQLSKMLKKLDPDAKIGRDLIKTHGDEWPLSATIAHDGDKYWVSGHHPSEEGIVSLSPKFDSWVQADDARKLLYEGYNQSVHSIPITPKMRDAILKGQTAFAEGGSVQGSGATEAADLDTLFQKYADPGYAMGGSVSPRAMANDNLVYDPNEIDAIAAQIRGAI